MEENFISEYISEIISLLIGKRFAISYRAGRIIEMWKERRTWNFFFQPHRNLPQTEMWKIISYWNTFMKFVALKCGRDFQCPTEGEELLKCGRKRRVWKNFPTVQKSSAN